jgi:acyl dehydratase
VYLVERGAIAAFARALGDPHPAYLDPEAAAKLGYGDVIAPPTFSILVSLGLLERSLAAEGVSIDRVVHGAQAFSLVRPVSAGDRLSALLEVTSRRRFGAGEIVVTTTQVRDALGETVATADATVVIGDASEPSPVPPPSPSSPLSFGVREGAVPLDAPVVPPSEVPLLAGAELPELLLAVTRRDLVRYAGASGDLNPIHYSDHAAARLGLPGVIAHGMLSMGLAARVVTGVLADPGRITRLSTRFTAPLVVPDDGVGAALRLGGRVAGVDERGTAIALTALSGGEKVLGQTKALVRA